MTPFFSDSDTTDDSSDGLASDVKAAAQRAAELLPGRQNGSFALNTAISAALTTAASTALKRWARSHRPGPGRLLRGAAAGAGAAGISLAGRALLNRDAPRPDVVDTLLAGAGRGVVYAAVLDPILPGPPVVRGAMTGLAEYLLAPRGGLLSRLSGLTVVERLPVVGTLMDAGDDAEDPFLAVLLYGVALGLLTGEADDADG